MTMKYLTCSFRFYFSKVTFRKMKTTAHINSKSTALNISCFNPMSAALFVIHTCTQFLSAVKMLLRDMRMRTGVCLSAELHGDAAHKTVISVLTNVCTSLLCSSSLLFYFYLYFPLWNSLYTVLTMQAKRQSVLIPLLLQAVLASASEM